MHEKTRVNVEKAISHQKMRVQPDRNGILQIPKEWDDASASSKKERDALNAFMLHYADLDADVRNNYLMQLRRLIQMYFYGKDAVIPDAFDVWKDHASNRTDNTLFLTNFTTQHKGDDGKYVESTGEKDYYALKKQWHKLQLLREKNRKMQEERRNNSGNNRNRISFEERNAMKVSLQEASDQVDYLVARIQDEVRFENIRAYRETLTYTKKHPELFCEDQNWNKCFVHLIENQCNLLFRKFSPKDLFRLTKGYLAEKCWKYLINYFSLHYIALGKAVYHYTCEDLGKSGDITLGVFKKGLEAINSFDYEMIQADMDLQRFSTVYITFAIQNFALNAIRDDYRAHTEVETDEDGNEMAHKFEDVMVYKMANIQDGKRPDALRRVLQFFGGKSKWQGILPADLDEDAFLMDIKNMLYMLRNKTFHFSTGNTDNSKWDEERILTMMQTEVKESSAIRRKTWYSNNLWMFYSQKALGMLMSFLYRDQPVRGAQVPSFKNILGRKALVVFLREAKLNPLDGQPADTRKMWLNSYYFVLKEIYYQKFLAEPTLKEDFHRHLKNRLQELEGSSNHTKDEEREHAALREFLEQWKQLDPDLTFSQICQYYMTEYEAQNQGIRVVQSTKMQNDKPKIYQHYKIILYHGIQNVFQHYIMTNDAYAFLHKPVYKDEKVEEENFLPAWTADTYHQIIENARNDRELQCWYVCSRFLAPRQVNHLAGVFRHYENYASNVARRAEENHQKISIRRDLSAKKCAEVVSLMDFSSVLSGKISSNFEDYFTTVEGKTAIEAYSDHISKYADLNGMHQKTKKLQAAEDKKKQKEAEKKKQKEADIKKNRGHVNSFADLSLLGFGIESKEIEPKEIEPEHSVIDDPANMYINPAHPILNRNVVLAMMYAPENVLENAVPKISYNEYEEYLKLKEEYPKNLLNGGSTKLSEQKLVNAFRDSKNRVELLNLYEYAEILSELQAKLVSWSYLRERDLLFFQLGFHYECLLNDSKKPTGYETITNAEGRTIHCAALYQTLAIFVHGYPLYKVKKDGSWNGKIVDPSAPTSAKAIAFDRQYKISEKCGAFDAGKELFQVMAEEGNVMELRDYIDHFKYYAKADRSMMDLYSEVFDRFFTYEERLRKNVPNGLVDILARHFIQVEGLHFETGKKAVGKNGEKERAEIRFNRLKSDTFTYNLIDDTKQDQDNETGKRNYNMPRKTELPAKGDRFLQDVENILTYHAGFTKTTIS